MVACHWHNCYIHTHGSHNVIICVMKKSLGWHMHSSNIRISAIQLTLVSYSTLPVTVWSLPSLCHSHHPNVVGGASLQCSQDGRCTVDSRHFRGLFWWCVHLPWLGGVLDSVSHSSTGKGMPHYGQSWNDHRMAAYELPHIRGQPVYYTSVK